METHRSEFGPHLRYREAAVTVVSRYAALADLSVDERTLLAAAAMSPATTHGPGETLLPTNALASPRIIISGWAAFVRQFRDARRQILHVLLPGDAIGIPPKSGSRIAAEVQALTPVQTIDARPVASRVRDRAMPALADAFAGAAAEEEGHLFGQIARLGRQTAQERMAHWYLELFYRLAARGLVGADDAFSLPMGQAAQADVLGLSNIHVNRTLKQMREDRWIVANKGILQILNRDALIEVAEFDAPRLRQATDDSHRQEAG